MLSLTFFAIKCTALIKKNFQLTLNLTFFAIKSTALMKSSN